jgi:ParB-like chromosome segregation protein Spo0J
MAELLRSIQEDPELMQARPLIVNQQLEVIAGNQRLRAVKRLGWSHVHVIMVDWPEEKQKRVMIKDNLNAGEWDWDMLANEWEAEELQSWGLDIPFSSEPEDEPKEPKQCKHCDKMIP